MIDFPRVFHSIILDYDDGDDRRIEDFNVQKMKLALIQMNIPFRNFKREGRLRVLSALFGRNIISTKKIFSDEYRAFVSIVYEYDRNTGKNNIQSDFERWLNAQQETN